MMQSAGIVVNDVTVTWRNGHTALRLSLIHISFHPIVDPLSRRIIAFEAIVQKNEDSPSAIAAVSYTHLDVYKRQGID